jgi:GNAT superfamily N-acetyltransferase
MQVPVLTRPVDLDDEVRLYRLWPRLSADTVYRRFHAPVRRLPPELVHRFVDVDHDRREAVVAVVGDEVVGIARYDRAPDDGTRAEFAVLVEDAWQGHGVGRQLLAEVLELAARRGVRTATASVQADNERTLALLRRLLPGSRAVVDASVYAVTGPLVPRPAVDPAVDLVVAPAVAPAVDPGPVLPAPTRTAVPAPTPGGPS